VRALHGFGLGVFVGACVLFLASVSAAFGNLPPAALLPFLDAVFPWFYVVTAAAALVGAFAGLARPGRALGVALSAVAFLLQLGGLLVLLPLVRRSLGTAAFFRLHGIALGVAAVAFLAVLAALGAALVDESGRSGVPKRPS
jgi:hypothetical protein